MSDDITELTRLILLRVEKASMKNMTILLYGCKGYFRICGMLNSKDNYINGFVAKPTKATHPRIAAKIKKVYHIWYSSRVARIKRAEENALNEQRMIAMKGWIQEKNKKAQREELKKGQADFRWFLFNVTNDFSDIYIKTWGRYLSYKVVMEVIGRAKMLKRAVALVPGAKNSKSWPRIFALPGPPVRFKDQDSMTGNFLIFGPYLRQSNSNLLLMQNVDGELMLRDEYEKRSNILRTQRTRCLWIYANTLQCLNDADPYPVKLIWNAQSEEAARKQIRVTTDSKENILSSSASGATNENDISMENREEQSLS